MSVLQRLRELEAAATPGPWRPTYWPIPQPTYAVAQADPNPISSRSLSCIAECRAEADSRHIAAARNHLPALLDIAEAADVFLAAFSGAADATFVAARRLSTALAALEAQEAT